ncbi:hypothetical protein EYZ11_008800 [Aspergillus tanneri]|nr:hypothetical protein EYZ11_008800 [Aspergillus tanneri]
MTALASIHREYVTESTPPSRPRIWENRNIGFALKQSNRAIQSLMQLLSEQCLTALDRMVVLTTNILFTCMCSLQGRQWQAFMHINNGLKLFHQWELGSKLISQPEDRIGADMLLLVFTRLDSQVRPYLLWQTPPLNWADSQITLSSTKAPFTTLLQAYVSLEVLFNGVMRFLLCPDTWSLSRQSVVSAEKLTYLHRLHEWDAKLANLLKDLLESDHGKAIDLLTIRRKFTGLLLATNLTQCELAHDAFLSDYVAIIEAVSRVLGDLKSLVLGRDQSAERPTHANFGLETGIVEPLFWIGVRCREPKIRHQALRLLQRYPRREGICEGMLAAKIVAKVIEIEETGCSQVAKKMCSTSPCTSGPWICEAHRVNTCDVILATERQVRVVIRTVEDWALSRPGTEFVTSWW